MSQPEYPQLQPPPPPSPRRRPVWPWVALGVALTVIAGIITLVLAVTGGQGDGDGQPSVNPTDTNADHDPQAAMAACETFVKARLKAPATAQFSNTGSAWEGGANYFVIGSVDSQNGFGALIRNNYECKVSRSSNDWVLVGSVAFTGK